MGKENESFRAAAENLHATMGKTDGSPIGAAAAAEQAADDTGKEEATYGPGEKFPEFLSMLLDGAAHVATIIATEDASVDEDVEITEDATELYVIAQTIDQIEGAISSMADELELEGHGDVAEFLRLATKKLGKGAKLARSNARDTLAILED